MRPLDQASFTNTSDHVIKYAVATVSLEITHSHDDICVIAYKKHIYGVMHSRVLVTSYADAFAFAALVMAKYPMRPFVCCIDL